MAHDVSAERILYICVMQRASSLRLSVRRCQRDLHLRTITAGGLHKIMRRHSKRGFGKTIPAQRVRDIGASHIANSAPNAVQSAAGALGHVSLRITERNNIQVDCTVADADYGQLLGHLMAQARGQTRRRRQRGLQGAAADV